MKNIIISLVLLVGSMTFAQSAEQLLKASDRARGGVDKGLTWISEVDTVEKGVKSIRKFKVRAMGVDANVEALEPSRNRGEIFLFNDRAMWFFKPSLKKPVTISPRQKLSGQAANGDIASTNYYRDYTPTLEKVEVIKGKKHSVLLLKAKNKSVTYDQIRYWIDNASMLATKADFLTLQGKVFKTATMEYRNKLKIDGKSLPFVSKLTIHDAKTKGNVSIIKYTSPEVESHSPQIFKVSSLKR